MLSLEKVIERDTCKTAMKLYGVPNCKMSPDGVVGYPDRIFWIPGGKPLLIEFKRPGEPLKPIQIERHKMLITLGYQVETHDNKESALSAICAAKIKALDTVALSKKSRKVST
jgi:hypothetical protein